MDAEKAQKKQMCVDRQLEQYQNASVLLFLNEMCFGFSQVFPFSSNSPLATAAAAF